MTVASPLILIVETRDTISEASLDALERIAGAPIAWQSDDGAGRQTHYIDPPDRPHRAERRAIVAEMEARGWAARYEHKTHSKVYNS